MTQLYLLANEYREAAAKLADLDLDDQTIADTLEGLSGDLEAKVVNVAMAARNFEAAAAQIKDAEAAMAARRKVLENRAANIRRYLMNCLQAVGIKKIESPHFAVAVKSNPVAVDVFDAAQIPADFTRPPEPQAPTPDKAKIKEALQAGREVSGARLVTGRRLEIK